MRSFRLALAVAFTLNLAACGYRTPLSLPKPQAKPAAAVPVEGEAK